MSRSSADPEALIGYAASMHNEGQAVLDHLGGAGITEKLDAVRTRCSEYVSGEIPDVAGHVRAAALGAQELDVWAGAVGQGFLLADTSGAAVVQVEDDAVIANLPPGLADPPAETRAKVAEGQRLFDDLMAATEERNHDRMADGLNVTGDLSDLSGTVRRLDPDLSGVRDALRQRLIDKGLTPEHADAIANRIASGTQFNRDNRDRYPFNEVYLTNGKVLDSYNPDLGEIVSRKNTQLADVQLSTAREYINEAVRKYPEDQEIASSPSVLRQEQLSGREIAGQPLRGDIILEVPSQARDVPAAVLEHARLRNVIIRTTDGVVLTP